MTSKIKPPQTPEALEKGPATPADRPLLDLSDAAINTLLRAAKKRGFVTHDQINSLAKEVNSEQIEDILARLSGMGINVVESQGTSDDEEPEEETASESAELVEVGQKLPTKFDIKEPVERTDDPVRMYLREMGSVQLLSRAGEIAIAKRIEAGREAMIAGLCESPLTFQAIIIWRDELNAGKALLRDIIDLEATYTGPDAKLMPQTVIVPHGHPIPSSLLDDVSTQMHVPPAGLASAAPFKGTPLPTTGEGEGEFEDDVETWVSLAAIEAELKPRVLQTLDNVADTYKRLRRLQDQDIEFKLKHSTLSPAQERRYYLNVTKCAV
jgi:RNA polymerase primary sigma factor